MLFQFCPLDFPKLYIPEPYFRIPSPSTPRVWIVISLSFTKLLRALSLKPTPTATLKPPQPHSTPSNKNAAPPVKSNR